MQLSHLDTSGEADAFSPTWLTSDALRSVLRSAPVGVARLQSLRNETGAIVDFVYHLINPIQRSLARHPEQDLANQSLIQLTPDVVRTGMLERLIQVVTTSQPCQHVEEYRLDDVVGRYDQLYVKSGDGVLMLVQDVTYSPLSAKEQQQQTTFIEAIVRGDAVADLRTKLIELMSGQRA